MSVTQYAVIATAALITLPGLPARGMASGLETSGIGARGRSMGYALTAVADDWSALYYNPAGLSRLGKGERACIYEFFTGSTSASFSLRNLPLDEGPDPSRGDFVDPLGDEPGLFDEREIGAEIHAGEFGWTWRRGAWGYGLGLFGSGAGTAWDDEIATDEGDLLAGKVSFRNISINIPFGVARTFDSRFSVGAAFGLRLGRLDALYEKVRSGSIPYTQFVEQKTGGFGAGVDLGLLWTPSARLSLGVTWRLPAFIMREGDTTVVSTLASLDRTSDTRVKEIIPSRVTFGTAFRPGRTSILAFSVTWLDWSAYERDTEYEDPIPGVLENSSGNILSWRDALVVNIGGEIRIADPWYLRCGLVWDQAPERDEHRTLVGGQTLNVWKTTFGLGRKSPSHSLDFGYTLTWGSEDGGYLPEADYHTAYHEIYLGLTWYQ